MSVAQPGQVLVDGRLGSMRGLQWRDEASALLLSPQLGAIELTQLGYLQVKVGGWVSGWEEWSAGATALFWEALPGSCGRQRTWKGAARGAAWQASQLPPTALHGMLFHPYIFCQPPPRRAWTTPSSCSKPCPLLCEAGSTPTCPPPPIPRRLVRTPATTAAPACGGWAAWTRGWRRRHARWVGVQWTDAWAVDELVVKRDGNCATVLPVLHMGVGVAS